MKAIDTSDWFIEAVGAIPGIHAFPSQGNSVLLECEGSRKTAEAFKQELLFKGVPHTKSFWRKRCTGRILPADNDRAA